MILVEDWKFHICLFLDKSNPRNNIMADDHLVKKTSPPRLSKCGFYIVVILYDLGQKCNFPLCLFLNKMGLEIMFADHPVRKQAFLD